MWPFNYPGDDYLTNVFGQVIIMAEDIADDLIDFVDDVIDDIKEDII